MSEQLGLMREVIASPVFGDTFEKADPARIRTVLGDIATVTEVVQPQLTGIARMGMPEWSDAYVRYVVEDELSPKLMAAFTGTSFGELSNSMDVVGAVTLSGGIMYLGDQTNDRGYRPATQACEVVGLRPQPRLRGPARHFLAALNHIETNIRSGGDGRGIALPEDQPYIVSCFYDQVLHNEAYMQRLSVKYQQAANKQKFMEKYGAHIADVTTVSAGFPSVSSSLHGMYRQEKPKLLPTLSEIYSNVPMQQLIQTCNVVARIWDELGDWYMDSGAVPEKGAFVINPFNEYHPSTVERYCELAFIKDPGQVALLKHAFKNFHNNDAERQMHSAYILESLRVHIRDYVNSLDQRLPPHLLKRYEKYIELSKRVLEFAYVNRKGDIDLAASAQLSET